MKRLIFSLLLVSSTALCSPLQPLATLSASDLETQWLPQFPEDQQALIGKPVCGIQVGKFKYDTVGGENEPTNASGALMIPVGPGPRCRGPRPVVLYAHGTAIDRAADLSAIQDPKNSAFPLAQRLALLFAAQGFIVIAPNYAGYDISSLSYAPYLNERQQATDMLDGLAAGRRLLAEVTRRVRDSGKLFVTGYSQGGYVAMATLKALDAQGRPATAGAPLSGPYALAAAGDEVFLGHPNFGASVYLSMIANSYAHLARGSIHLADVFNPRYADAPRLFPGNVNKDTFKFLVQEGKIPLAAIFQSPPTGYANLDALHEGLLSAAWLDPSNYLVSSAYRSAYVSDIADHPDGAAPADGSPPDLSRTMPRLPSHPGNPLRQALKKNDLRDYTPSMPLFLCGAHRDPEVFWIQGAATMKAMLDSKIKNHPTLRYAVLDLDTQGHSALFSDHGFSMRQHRIMKRAASTAQRTFVAHQYRNAFDQVFTLLSLDGYHAAEEPYCTAAARTFFGLFSR
ncbi:MAG: prolyl oligopeptidase family serine peptidase [Betaproteobacteria bacterium]|nr:prolyl oligopeptidase family serine peptidase [Betaproteobacteria bacterium]